MIWVNDCFRSEVGRDGSVGSTAGGRRSQTERSTFPDRKIDVPRQEDRRSQTWRPTFLGREVDVSSSGGCGALMFLLMGIDGGKGIAIPRGSVGDGFEEGAVGFCGAEAY